MIKITQNQVYDDNETVRNILSTAELPKGIYINVNFTDETSRYRPKRSGLDYALEQLQTAQLPIVLYSFETTYALFSDKRFMEALSNQNVHFVRLPAAIGQIREYVSLPTFQNPALEIAASAQGETDLLSILRHDYRRNPQKIIERARSELGIKSDKEIEELLQNYDLKLPQTYTGQFPGFFCDVEGTLLRNGEINADLASGLIEYAKQYAVTLWTGGDVKKISGAVMPKLEKVCEAHNKGSNDKTNLHLRTPILSKHIFRGSKPEIVLDDLTLDEFRREYGIEPQQYRQIQ